MGMDGHCHSASSNLVQPCAKLKLGQASSLVASTVLSCLTLLYMEQLLRARSCSCPEFLSVLETTVGVKSLMQVQMHGRVQTTLAGKTTCSRRRMSCGEMSFVESLLIVGGAHCAEIAGSLTQLSALCISSSDP
eukprot:596694-Amphidinium_carterae.2